MDWFSKEVPVEIPGTTEQSEVGQERKALNEQSQMSVHFLEVSSRPFFCGLDVSPIQRSQTSPPPPQEKANSCQRDCRCTGCTFKRVQRLLTCCLVTTSAVAMVCQTRVKGLSGQKYTNEHGSHAKTLAVELCHCWRTEQAAYR